MRPCLQVFRQAGPPQRAKCLALKENKGKVSFPRTQQRIGSLESETFQKPTLRYNN